MLNVRLQIIEDFRDFQIYPKLLKKGTLVEVDQMTWDKMRQSHPGCAEVLEKVVPPSNVKPKPKKKESDVKAD